MGVQSPQYTAYPWHQRHHVQGTQILSISHAYQSDGLRNLTEALVQLVFRVHMPTGLEYASYPREVYAFLR